MCPARVAHGQAASRSFAHGMIDSVDVQSHKVCEKSLSRQSVARLQPSSSNGLLKCFDDCKIGQTTLPDVKVSSSFGSMTIRIWQKFGLQRSLPGAFVIRNITIQAMAVLCNGAL